MILLKLKFTIKKSSYYTAQLPCRLRGHPENQNPNPHNASSLLRICGSQGPVYAYYATSFRLSVHARRVQHHNLTWLSGCQAEMRRSQDSQSRSPSGLGTWEERQFLEATVTVVTVSADLCWFHGHKG